MSIYMSPTLLTVVGNDMCTGCGLCAGLAPDAVRMTAEAPGFSRPEQIGRISPDAEKAIALACPGKAVAPWEDAPLRDPVWGPAYRVMTGHSTDPDIRFCGSSGGVVSALAFHAITSGLVDRVLMITADPEKPTRNILRWATTREQIISGAGSRYAPSSPLEQIGEALDGPGKFAFVGKPCDVSALRLLAGVDPRVGEKIPLMLSFFCAGVPSHDSADEVIRALDMKPEEVVHFRYRGLGWPGPTRAVAKDGSVQDMTYAESWGKYLSGQVQFRCKVCPDGVGGVADVSCADAWYGDANGFPVFEEVDGRSLIMSRTPVGDFLLGDAIAKGAVEAVHIEMAEIDKMQPGQIKRKLGIRSRLAACEARKRWRPAMDGLDIAAAAARLPFRAQVREFLGTWKRIRK